jgi:hypothetical protein
MSETGHTTSQRIVDLLRERIDDNRKSLEDLLRVYLYRILFLLMIVLFAWVGGWMPERANPSTISETAQEKAAPLKTDNSEDDAVDGDISDGGETAELATELIDEEQEGGLFNRRSMRYIIMPLIAFVFVLFAGMRYLQDVYALKYFRDAVFYVTSSMFGLYFERIVDLVVMLFFPLHPKLTIDDGKMIIPRGKTNLLASIGGPGYVIVQPGNAVFFKFLRKRSSPGINLSAFLAPFETIGPIVNLDDQHGMVLPFETMTKDGILVEVKDVQFRYRIIYRHGEQRSLEDPYPFDPSALRRRGANVTVNAHGPVPWTQAISRSVKSMMIEYINSHTVDFMTAPRDSGIDVRQDFMRFVLNESRVWESGAELLWLDVGHVNIVASTVDSQRVELWASEWVGNAEVTRAYGEAKRVAYQDIARAEARAEMIISIASALESASLSTNPKDNIRKILLDRTAQILEAMRDNDASASANRNLRDRN